MVDYTHFNSPLFVVYNPEHLKKLQASLKALDGILWTEPPKLKVEVRGGDGTIRVTPTHDFFQELAIVNRELINVQDRLTSTPEYLKLRLNGEDYQIFYKPQVNFT